MRLQHFGDSYDIVKKAMLQWLEPFGPWAAHPMFTEPFTPMNANKFARFLGVPLVSFQVLEAATDRDAYFAVDLSRRSLFLDPDTGLRPRGFQGRGPPQLPLRGRGGETVGATV
jgi:hypothetical protein